MLIDTARLAPEKQGPNVPLPAVFSLSDASSLEISVAYKSYYEKLKDPRWQKRRLEIMDRAKFACEKCCAAEKTLNVHHALYRKGADPWDYADSELRCLCEDCHEEAHVARAAIDEALARAPEYQEQILGYIEGIIVLHEGGGLGDTTPVDVRGAEYAIGLGEVAGLSAHEGLCIFARSGVTAGYVRRIHRIALERSRATGADIWNVFPYEIDEGSQ